MPVPADGSTLWYMVVYDELDQPKTVKGTTDTIRKNIQAGTLGNPAQVLVCRSKTGPFAPLRTVPEFRDLILEESLSADGSKSGLRAADAGPPSSRVRLAPVSKARLNPPSGTRLAAGESPSRGRLNPPSARRLAPPPAVNEPTPMPIPPPPADGHRTFDDGTDEVSAVPLTDMTNVNLDSAERPKLSTRWVVGGDARPPGGSRGILLVAGIAAALAAAAVAAYLLTR